LNSEWARAERLLHETLSVLPDHVEAQACLAALRAATGRFKQLAELASRMNRPEVDDARFHLLGAACCLAAGDAPAVLDAAQRVLSDAALAAEGHFLIGMAHLQMNDPVSASASFREVTRSSATPSLGAARARLGKIAFAENAYDEAIAWWKGIEPEIRRDWQLEQPLQGVVFLAGLLALRDGDYERAAGRLVEARQLGCLDPRLTALLPLVLVQAGQQLLFGTTAPPLGETPTEPSANGQAHPAEVAIYRYRPVVSDTTSS
jgi:tetratricopeptide (TPR) repeat protein